MVTDDIEGQVGQGRDNQKCGEEEQSLHPAAAQQAFRPRCQAGGGASSQQQPEKDQTPERARDVQNVANAAKGDSLGQLVGRQRICLRIGLGSGRLSLGRRGGRLGGGRLSSAKARIQAGEKKSKAKQRQRSARKCHGSFPLE
jgi:hypothetical protein